MFPISLVWNGRLSVSNYEGGFSSGLQTTNHNCQDSVRTDRPNMKNSSDKLLLGHGIDIAASLSNNNNKVIKDANSCDVEEEPINVSTNNGKQIPDKFHPTAHISSLFKQVTSSRQIKVSTYESIHSHKDRSTIEVNLDRRMNDDLPFIDYKDLNSYDSDVIIEIVKREHIKEEGELTDSEDDAETLRDSGTTKHIKRRMINGDKILPFPMDSYPCEDSMSGNIQKKRNEAMYSQQSYRSNEHNYRSWYGEEMVSLGYPY
ncbi:hypothetical protein ABFS83_05G147600 [Erythranthe nasuta]